MPTLLVVWHVVLITCLPDTEECCHGNADSNVSEDADHGTRPNLRSSSYSTLFRARRATVRGEAEDNPPIINANTGRLPKIPKRHRRWQCPVPSVTTVLFDSLVATLLLATANPASTGWHDLALSCCLAGEVRTTPLPTTTPE